MKFDREKAEADPLIAIAGGGNLFNSQGNAWTADYLKIAGELDVRPAQQYRSRSPREDRLRKADQFLRRC
jgi:hypothetical protein